MYTLLYIITDDKLVHLKTFLTLQALKDFKNYYIEQLKDCDLKPVDKEGYVWFCELIFE